MPHTLLPPKEMERACVGSNSGHWELDELQLRQLIASPPDECEIPCAYCYPRCCNCALLWLLLLKCKWAMQTCQALALLLTGEDNERGRNRNQNQSQDEMKVPTKWQKCKMRNSVQRIAGLLKRRTRHHHQAGTEHSFCSWAGVIINCRLAAH